jgi:hypothetical protein
MCTDLTVTACGYGGCHDRWAASFLLLMAAATLGNGAFEASWGGPVVLASTLGAPRAILTEIYLCHTFLVTKY